MTAIAYRTKAGTTQYKPVATQEELWSDDGDKGFCLGCGAEASGVEPDARRYPCESCGAAKVYGLQELAIMGLLTIEGDD